MDTLDLKKLKLIARDLEDLQILAAHLQDALIPYMSMQYDPVAKTFTALVNRFCWEHGEMPHEDGPLYHRAHAGLSIHNVKSLKKRGFHTTDTNRLYNLLTLHGDEEGALHLVFSDGHEIRAEIEDIHLHLGDLHHPWPTHTKPKHIHEHLAETN